MDNSIDDILDFRQFLFRIFHNWYLFIISVFLMLIIAFGYNRYSHEQYLSETSIIIKENNSFFSASEMLYDRSNYNNPKNSIQNKELLFANIQILIRYTL